MLKLNIVDNNKLLNPRLIDLFTKTAVFAAKLEGLSLPCFASVTITDDTSIKELNFKLRNIYSATD
ncbi:MAG: hypothetical protein Q4E07_07195, partial [Eubacteriales bacterium]|nr:hypothetical protein [Eubacteriales bacterium]